MLKVLVTGGYGLVGKALQQEAKTLERLQFFYIGRQSCDFREYDQVQRTFAEIQPDIVVHLCARVGGVYDNMKNNFTYLMENMQINNNVMNACREFKVKKLLNMLSTCIFPNDGVSYPLTSDQLHNGLPHYSNIGYAYSKRLLHVASKLMIDSQVAPVQVVNLIPTNLYGENDNFNINSGHVLPALIHKMYNAKQTASPLKVKGNGMAVRQFLYARDLAKVIIAFVESTSSQQEITCIVSPPEESEISINNLVEKLKNAFGWHGKVIYESGLSNGQYKKTTTNNEVNFWLPNFQFTPLDTGLDRVVQYFVTNYDSVRK